MAQLNLQDFRIIERAMTADEQARIDHAISSRKGPSFSRTAGLAFSNIGLTRSAWRHFRRETLFADDPAFVMSPDMVKEYGAGLPREKWPAFDVAGSPEEAEHIREGLLKHERAMEELSRAGWTGTALTFAASLTDPAELAVQIGANALVPGSGLLAKGATAGNAMRRAATAGLIFAGTDVALLAADSRLTHEDYQLHDYAVTALMSFGLGGGLEYRALRKVEQRAAAITPHIIDAPDSELVEVALDEAALIAARREALDEAQEQAGADLVGAMMENAAAETAEAQTRTQRFQTLLRQWAERRRAGRVATNGTNLDTVLKNIDDWERQHEMPAPIARTSGGALIYPDADSARRAADRLQRNIDRDHTEARFREQNIPAEARSAKPEIQVEEIGGVHHVRLARNGQTVDAMPYVSRTAEARMNLAARQAVIDRQLRDLEYDMLSREAGGDAATLLPLTDKGRAYFHQQIARAATPEDDFINGAMARHVPGDVARLVESGERTAPRLAVGATTPEDIAARAVAEEEEIVEAALRRAARDRFDWDARWAESGYVPKDRAGGLWSIATATGRSDHDDVRVLSRLLVEHPRLDVEGRPVTFSASEWMERETYRTFVPVKEALDEHYNAWAKAKGVRAPLNPSAQHEFREAVYHAVIRGADDDPNVAAAASKLADYFGYWLDRAKRLGLEGFDEIPADRTYAPWIWKKPLIDRVVAQFGSEQTIELIRRAWLADRMVIDPKLTLSRRRNAKSITKIERRIKERAAAETKLRAKYSGDELAAKLERRSATNDKLRKRLAALQVRRDEIAAEIEAAAPVPMRLELQERLARGVYERIQRVGEFNPMNHHVLFTSNNREALAYQLRQLSADLSEGDIEEILSSIHPGRADGARISRAKRRIDMNRDYEHPSLKWSDGKPLRIDDLVEKDSLQLAQRYTRDMLGGLALDEIFRVMQREGKPRIRSVPQLLQNIADEMRLRGAPEPEVRSTLDRLDTALRTIDGRPLRDGLVSQETSRLFRDFNTMRLMGKNAIAQLGDAGDVLAEAGLRTIINTLPIRELTGLLRTGKWKNELSEEVDQLLALGMEHKLNNFTARFDATGDAFSDSISKTGRGMRAGANATLRISASTLVDSNLIRWSARLMAHKWALIAESGRFPSKNRLAAMGFTEDDARRTLEMIKKHSTREQGLLGKRMRLLNMDDWTDQEIASKFMIAITKTSRRVVQRGDIGQAAMWMSNPVGRIIVQFRMFPIVAWHKKVMFNYRDMHDYQSLVWLGWTLMTGLVSNLANTATNAAGMPEEDREKYLNERLSPRNLALGAWQRSSGSSLLPMFIDTGLGAAGIEPWFHQGRTTGLPASAFLGNPTLDVGNAAGRAVLRLIRAPIDPNYRLTQPDVRALRTVLPFQNVYFIQQILDSWQYSLPTEQERN